MTASVENSQSAMRLLDEGLQELGNPKLTALGKVIGETMGDLCARVEAHEAGKAVRTWHDEEDRHLRLAVASLGGV